MKHFTYTIALLIGITTAAFANNGDKDKKNPTAKPEIMLTAEEAVLEAELEAEFEINVADVIAELTAEPTVNTVKVYDLNGNIISTQNGIIDFSKVPVNAELLMTDGTTQYYIITE